MSDMKLHIELKIYILARTMRACTPVFVRGPAVTAIVRAFSSSVPRVNKIAILFSTLPKDEPLVVSCIESMLSASSSRDALN